MTHTSYKNNKNQENKDNNQRVKYNQKTQKETTKPEQIGRAHV